MKRFLLLPSLLFCLGCGDDGRAPGIDPGSGANGGQAGTNGGGGRGGGVAGEAGGGMAGEAGAGEAGAGEAGAGSDPGAPEIEILAPAAVDDPADGGVLLDDEVTVLCEVKPSEAAGASPVNPSSVVIRATDANGAAVSATPTAPADEQGQYRAVLTLLPENHGALSIQCNAADTALQPRQGMAEITTFFDAGPEILPGVPQPESTRALEGVVPFSFTVLPRPLTAGDAAAAAVSEVTLAIEGVEIDDLSDDGAGMYTAMVNLADKTLFPTGLTETVFVSISAENSREPEPKATGFEYFFAIDNEGPIIEITSPKQDEIAGSKVTLEFNVSDPSGVDPTRVVVQIENTEFRYDRAKTATWQAQDGDFSFKFDTSNAQFRAEWQLTVNVKALDSVGNEGRSATSFFLDNQPPFIHLDPAPVREFSDRGECSLPFDPLGPGEPLGRGSPNQGKAISKVGRFRALVWDRTNTTAGSPHLYHARTDPNSVSLYVQPAIGEPIVFDDDRDGTCDSIVATPRPIQKRLFPLGADGTAPRGPTPRTLNCQHYATSNVADLGTVCENTSDLNRVIQHSMPGAEPVIYALSNQRGEACTGNEWEIGALVTGEGWACLAAQGRDERDNWAVSPPLAVCVSDEVAPEPPCATSSVAPPACTRDCTPAPERAPENLLDDGSWGVRLH